MRSSRDDFSEAVKRTVAERVNRRCSRCTYNGIEAERTDEDGHVEFLIPEGFIHTASTVTLSVEGDEGEEYEVEDGDSFTLTYD